jgi:uroporphyrinogen decarboxylase
VSALANDTLLRALRREPVPHVPVWMMRQAGRYLPEYNATRSRAGSFLALCKSPAMATEVTLQPLARFAFDAAILFSDILTIPDAMGLGLHFAEGEGPRFERPLRDEAALVRLEAAPLERLAYVFDAVREIKRALAGRVPLIGFAGSPFTLACYMIEGRGSADFAHVKRVLYDRPDLLHRVLAVTAESVSAYLAEQAAAGADALMLFDTWGGVLSTCAHREFSLRYLASVLRTLDARGVRAPRIVFTKGGGQWLDQIVAIGAEAVGLDWTVDLAGARARFGSQVALQGNLDPLALLASQRAVVEEARRIVREAGPAPGFVFNLGHGIVPSTPPENVGAVVDAVHAESLVLSSAAS